MDRDVPAEGPHTADDGLHRIEVGAAEMRHEAEPGAADAGRVHLGDRCGGRALLQQGHGAVAAAAVGQCVQHGAVVPTVPLALHQHRAVEAEGIVHLPQGRFRRERRVEAAILGHGEAVERAVDVAMGVAAPGWRPERGLSWRHLSHTGPTCRHRR